VTATSWREEARQDRLLRAQIDRDRDAARAQVRIAERQASARLRREAEQARVSARQQARKARAARRAQRAMRLRAHVVDALFVPVIVVPAVLAWTAMAAYGSQVYGPAGLALPAFSEGAMWAFAAATTITRRRHPARPVWHLRAGTVVFAAVGAALNFAHAMTSVPGGPPPRGPVTGVVYAVVSVAGVSVHQLVTAGPRRSRAERDQARLDRAAARRERAARRAALRRAVADIDERGNARLVFEPGLAALARHRGRARLTAIAGSGQNRALTVLPAGPVCPWPQPTPVPAPAPGSVPAPAPGSAPAPGRTRTPGRARTRTRGRTPAVTGESAEVHFAADLAEGHAPSARRIKAELHVGQDRAAQIHDHLAAVVTASRQLSRRTA
jgi:hypothetical protein